MPREESSAAEVDKVVQEERALVRKKMIERIQDRMAVLKLNPFSTARKAGLGADYVRDLIRGKVKEPSADRLGRIAEALECSLPYLIGREEEPVSVLTHDGRRLPDAPPPIPGAPATSTREPALLEVRHELLGATFRPASEVSGGVLGHEAGTIPQYYSGRDSWFEVISDESCNKIAPRGSLVQVVSVNDDERLSLLVGDFVIVVKRIVRDGGAVHVVERSMRRVSDRGGKGVLHLDYYSDLAPWTNQPHDILRYELLTPPGPGTSAPSAELDVALLPGIEKVFQDLKDPQDRQKWLDLLESYRKYRAIVVGKVIRILIPTDPSTRFGPAN